MSQITVEMAAEYERIRRRASEDPGTAGDEGEENWAALLREWLPRTYTVVTKGRILGSTGSASPQVDVLVLRPSYPEKLVNKKMYLAAGVAAAFECKTTLKADHIETATQSGKEIRELLNKRLGSPHRELNSPLIYGVLAHSHSWKAPQSKPAENIEQALFDAGEKILDHPRQLIDLVCVADLATWVTSKASVKYPCVPPGIGNNLSEWIVVSGFQALSGMALSGTVQSTPIGVMLAFLIFKMAWEDATLRPIADYFREGGLWPDAGGGPARFWPVSIYSEATRNGLVSADRQYGLWDEWGGIF